MRYRAWIFAGLLAVPFLQACGKKQEDAGGAAAEKFDSPWSCEEHWMVASTVKDLQGMAKLSGAEIGGESTVPTKADHEFQVGKVVLKMAPSCWDLASYQLLMAAWKPVPQAPAGPAPELLHDLLTPTAKSLQKANKAVSERIKATPSAAEVHEEAAFLLAVLGMRENACHFSDIRPLLCRMTAHLVAARQLRGGTDPSAIGRWAEVFYDYHAGRPIPAREKAQAIAAEGDSGRWKRVIELLITGDWRRTQDLGDPSLAEAIAHARAVKTHLGITEMMKYVGGRKDLQAIPEWSRTLSGASKSVDEGHLAMNSCATMEFEEIREIFRIGKDPDPEKVAAFLKADDPAALVDKEGALRVISDSDWAGYFRRHFYMICGDINRFAIQQWGEPNAAEEWRSSVLPYCVKWPDHELVEPSLDTRTKTYQDDLRKTAGFIRHHPEKVPMGLWYDYRFPTLPVSAETPMPDQVPWFREVSPPGTAHEPVWRIRFSGIQDDSWVNHIKALHQIDPWDTELCYELAENTGNNPESVKAAWGELREYSRRPLTQTLSGPALTNEQRIETLRTLTELDPDYGLNLGVSLVMAGRPEEAVKAYETAYEKSPDRVGVSNRTRWLIFYYLTHDQAAKAREVADHNAETYSSAGLESALALAIRQKDLTRAKELSKAMAERYGDGSGLALTAWLLGGDEKVLRKVFPEGLREVTLADLEKEMSFKGCRLDDTSTETRILGMKRGDLILAIDGKRVETFIQYRLLMSSTLDPQTRIIYRRGKKIMEISCQLPDRLLHVDMHDMSR